MKPIKVESHRYNRVGWMRAAVLGANDGIISTASLILGIAATSATHDEIIVAGIAALVAGSMSMAAGEYVSVSSQSDIESADIKKEKDELKTFPKEELLELTHIYINRGLEPALAEQVAKQLTEKNALKAHLRDELGIHEVNQARPLQAALVSALTFSVGAAFPLLIALLGGDEHLPIFVSIASLFFLTALGSTAAFLGGASLFKGGIRVLFWGALAMLVTSGIGSLFDSVAT